MIRDTYLFIQVFFTLSVRRPSGRVSVDPLDIWQPFQPFVRIDEGAEVFGGGNAASGAVFVRVFGAKGDVSAAGVDGFGSVCMRTTQGIPVFDYA